MKYRELGSRTRLRVSEIGLGAWGLGGRQFVLPVRLEPGQYILASRAQDVQFHWQVDATPANGGGYLNSGWRAHALPLTVT